MAEINTIIKNVRDVLVGKVPDPKAQVEQITIALMYKFMDAKDLESMEFGGEVSFFIGELAKYSYHKIMETSNNTKKLDMYKKGLELLGESLELPDIFRTIFKNAYLPYNDPATAALFLKELDKIPTDNTELLGTAFEDLLSIMGSQGDAGQFRTPRHIIDFMVDIIKPQKSENILDPACGTAGFLVSAFSYIRENNNLTIEEKEKLKTSFRGYDISPDMVRLAKVNMFLHGFKDPKIEEYDTLTFKDYWKEKFDVILANPPFMTPKGGINPHELFTIKANRSEVLFVDYILNHLKKNGRAGVIVPEGIVFQSQNAYKALRKELVEDGLYAVVSLPSGVFNPYSSVKTSILLMDKQIAKATEHILFIKLKNDGFDLGAQRRPTPEKNELSYALEILESYKNAILKGEDVTEIFTNDNFKTLVAKEKIAENGEYSLVGDRYKEAIVHNSSYQMVELGEVCEVASGYGFPNDLQGEETSDIPFYKVSDMNLIGNEITLYDSNNYVSNNIATSKRWKVIDSNTIVFPKIGAAIATDKKRMLSTESLFDNNVMGLVCSDKILKKYLFYSLKNVKLSLWASDSNPPSIRKTVVESFKIPLPPLHIQEQIVAEIEGYQKIVDGAKQIVDNYKPTIKINPNWDMVKLGDVCDIKSGGTPDRSNESYWNGNIPYVKTGLINFNIISEADEFITEEGLNNSSAKVIPKGSVLMAMYGQGVTRGRVAILNIDAAINQAVSAIQIKYKETLDINYLFITLSGMYTYLREISSERGGNQSNLNGQIIKSLYIPLPPIEEQQQIVAMIELEQVAVNGAKALMQIFEQKIKDKISEVWGE
jgi:type I restriction enzyme M protein